MAKTIREGYKVIPSIDKERYDDIPGMEGPFMTLSGKVVYYDPKQGAYYDRDTDMYLSYDDFKDYDTDYSGMKDERDIPVKENELGDETHSNSRYTVEFISFSNKQIPMVHKQFNTFNEAVDFGNLNIQSGSYKSFNVQMMEQSADEDTDYKYFKHHYNKWNTKYVETGEHDADRYRMAMHHLNKMKKKATPGSSLYQALNKHSDVKGDVQRMQGVVAAKDDFAKRKAMKNIDEADTSYEKDIDNSKPVIASGVKGMKSTPFRKKFKNMSAYEKWSDSEEAGNYEVHNVMNEDISQGAHHVKRIVKEESASLDDKIRKIFGKFYDYGDAGLDYLDSNAPLYDKLADQFDGDLDAILANTPDQVKINLAKELVAVYKSMTGMSEAAYKIELPGKGGGVIHTDNLDIFKGTKTKGGGYVGGQEGEDLYIVDRAMEKIEYYDPDNSNINQIIDRVCNKLNCNPRQKRMIAKKWQKIGYDVRLDEGLGDDAHYMERDHEVQMARSDLYKTANYAIKLHAILKGISEEQGLEGWMQAKITKAADYLGSVFHALEYDQLEKNQPMPTMEAAEQVDEAGSVFDPSDHEKFENMTPEQKKAEHDSLMKLANTHKHYGFRKFAKSAANELKSKYMKESVEQVDEISKDLARKYYTKAAKDIGSQAASASDLRIGSSNLKGRLNRTYNRDGSRTKPEDRERDKDTISKYDTSRKTAERKIKNRATGMSRASAKMEEVEQVDEAVNTKRIAADYDAGHSMDVIVQKHLNKKGDNKDEILKAVRDHRWKTRMKKEEVELDEGTTEADWKKDSAAVKKSKDPKFISKMIDKWGQRGGAWLNHPALKEEVEQVDEAYINSSMDAINTLSALRKIGKSIETGQGSYDGNLANMYADDVWDVVKWLENNTNIQDPKFKQVIEPVLALRKKAKGMEREPGSGKNASFGNEIVNTLYPLMQWIEMNVREDKAEESASPLQKARLDKEKADRNKDDRSKSQAQRIVDKQYAGMKVKLKNEEVAVNEAYKLDKVNIIYSNPGAEQFAKHYRAGMIGDYRPGGPNDRDQANSEKFHTMYSSEDTRSGFAGSGTTVYTNNRTGEKFEVDRVANGKGFHGTDHHVSVMVDVGESIIDEGKTTFGAAVNRAEQKRQAAIRRAKAWMKRTGKSAADAAIEFDLLKSDVAKLNETTSAGGIAAVVMPMGKMIKRKRK